MDKYIVVKRILMSWCFLSFVCSLIFAFALESKSFIEFIIYTSSIPVSVILSYVVLKLGG